MKISASTAILCALAMMVPITSALTGIPEVTRPTHVVCGADPTASMDGGCLITEFKHSEPSCDWGGPSGTRWDCDVSYSMTLTLAGTLWCGTAKATNDFNPVAMTEWFFCSGIVGRWAWGPVFGPHTFRDVPQGGTNMTVYVEACIAHYLEDPSGWPEAIRCETHPAARIYLPGPP